MQTGGGALPGLALPRRRRAARARPALRPHHRRPGLRRRARGVSASPAPSTPPPTASAGTRSSPARARASSAPTPVSGHGGMAALDTAHAALALGLPTLLSPRLSAADPRERHRGVSHHTLTVLRMLLARGGRRGPRRARPRSPRSWPTRRPAPPPPRSPGRPRRATQPPASRPERWAAPSTRTRSSSRRPWPRVGPGRLLRVARGRGVEDVDPPAGPSPRDRTRGQAHGPLRIKGRPARARTARMASQSSLARRARQPRRRRPLRGPGPRLPLLPGAGARPLPQHPERLPHRSLQYGEYLAAHDLDALTARPADIADFLAELATGNGRPACSASTIHRKAACLRSFYKHLRRDELIGDDPTAALSAPRRAKKLPQVLNYSEVQKLLAAPRGDEPTALRDRALLEVMYACGLRASETIGLELGRHRPARGLPARPRQGLQGTAGAARPPGDRGDQRLPARRRARSWSASATSRSCSSTSAAARSPARASTRSSSATPAPPASRAG